MARHDDLCPRLVGWWKKCRCELILEVRSSQRKIDKPDLSGTRELMRKWYHSGRQDSAEIIEELLHDETCDCDFCKGLTAAYLAVLGHGKGA